MADITGDDIPKEVWHKTLGHLGSDSKSLEALFVAGQVCRALKEIAFDQQLWSRHRNSWSPEFCGSLRTVESGKNFRMLYRRWCRGKPMDNLTFRSAHVGVQNQWGERGVKAIKLSQAGALVAWSMGVDGALLRTDVTTCTTRRCSTPDSNEGFACLEVLHADGRVFTGGKNFICWDPRQSPISNEPIFKKDYFEASRGSSSFVSALISAESIGQPYVLTGGNAGDICLWDLRQTKEYVRKYAQQGPFSPFGTQCLAYEPRHRTLIGGGQHGLVFWNFDSGEAWATPPVYHPVLNQGPLMYTDIQSIAVGTERMIVGGHWAISEWAIPDPNAANPRQLQGVTALPTSAVAHMVLPNGSTMPHPRCVQPRAMQAVGKGPAGILAGTADGSIGMWECLNNRAMARRHSAWLYSSSRPPSVVSEYTLNHMGLLVERRVLVRQQSLGLPPIAAPEQLQKPVVWTLKPRPQWFDRDWEVSCLAATDEIMVNGFRNGGIRIAQMKQF